MELGFDQLEDVSVWQADVTDGSGFPLQYRQAHTSWQVQVDASVHPNRITQILNKCSETPFTL